MLKLFKFKPSYERLINILVLVVCLYSVSYGLSDYDYYWQARLGRYIIKDFNFNGIYELVWGKIGIESYFDHEWLMNIVFYFSTLLGQYGVFFLKLIITIAIASAIIYSLGFFNSELNSIEIICFSIVLFLTSTLVFKVKAYSFSVVFVLLEIVWLYKYKQSQRNKYFALMLGLLLIWNNVHSGSIPLFFVIAGVFWLVHLREKKVLIFGVVCALCTLINPYGYRLILFNFAHNGDKVMKLSINDWRPIDAKLEYGVVCFIILAIMLLTICIGKYENDWFVTILGILFLYLVLQSARHIIYLLPVYVMVLGRCDLPDVLEVKKRSILYGLIVFFTIIGVGACVHSLVVNYPVNYCMNYTDDKLKSLLLETNKDTSEGLFSTEMINFNGEIELKGFYSGGYPLCPSRVVDSLYMQYYASPKEIEKIINHYGLTKFCFVKGNVEFVGYNVNSSLYNYLKDNSNYKCLYDGDYYCYFVKE